MDEKSYERINVLIWAINISFFTGESENTNTQKPGFVLFCYSLTHPHKNNGGSIYRLHKLPLTACKYMKTTVISWCWLVVYGLVAGWPDVNPPPKQEQNTHTKDCFGQIKVWAVDRFHALVWWLGGTWPSGNPTPYTNKQYNNMNNNVFVGGLEKTCLLLLFCH